MRRFLAAAAFLAAMSCSGELDEDFEVDEMQAELSASDYGMALMLPFPAGTERTITRTYGVSTHVKHGTYEWDDAYALDFAGGGCGATWGTPVLAAASGTVARSPVAGSSAVLANLNSSYGDSQVVIDHGNGCFTHYGHLDSRRVAFGQRVQQGEVIGTVGNKGNVESQCSLTTPHRGAHLHFKLVCGGVAAKPEPLSGYSDLGNDAGKKVTHKAFHHPPGTLIKSPSSPDIFVVTGANQIRKVRNETVWRSYRFFQDASYEWATVVNVSSDEIACHARGLDLDVAAKIEATTCLSGASWVPSVSYVEGTTRWRRRIPFATTSPEYAILLRSWGFRTTDVVRNAASCSIPDSGPLPLRDGSVVEASDDNDFYVVTGGGTAYRLYRNLMPVLYGNNWNQVIQIPSGSLPSLVTRVDTSKREFTVTDATTCPNGSRRLEPAYGSETGGGETDGAAIGPTTVSAPSPAPTPSPVPAVTTDAPQTIRCTKLADGKLQLKITGPILSALVVRAEQPKSVQYGSDSDGWTVPYASGKPAAAWTSDAANTLTLPANVNNFNLYVVDGANAARNSWFDLVDANSDGIKWRTAGDCRISRTKIVR